MMEHLNVACLVPVAKRVAHEENQVKGLLGRYRSRIAFGEANVGQFRRSLVCQLDEIGAAIKSMELNVG